MNGGRVRLDNRLSSLFDDFLFHELPSMKLVPARYRENEYGLFDILLSRRIDFLSG